MRGDKIKICSIVSLILLCYIYCDATEI